jgi:hypothetical protein
MLVVAAVPLVTCELATAAETPTENESIEPTAHTVTSISGTVPGKTSGSVELVFNTVSDPSEELVAATTPIGPSGTFAFAPLPKKSDFTQAIAPAIDQFGAGTDVNISISDETVPVAFLSEIRVLDDAGDLVGTLSLLSIDSFDTGEGVFSVVGHEVEWIYSEGTTEVVSTFESLRYVLHAKLEPGWNVVVTHHVPDEAKSYFFSGPIPSDAEWELFE